MIAAITGNLWRAAALALGGIVLALLLQIHGLPILGGGLIAARDKAVAQALAERAAHQTTKDRYIAAQADAARAEAFRLARVKAEQERINADVESDHQRQLDSARARYERMRREAAAAVGSSANGQPVPGLPAPAFGPDAAAGADGLAVSELNLAERWEATQQALQLAALITWVEQQAAVRTDADHP